ncbi:MAG: SSS family solute:Na+ symporter [Candidatus Omnitrophota bacterium]|jgi:SSS family solute:Na+ symporter
MRINLLLVCLLTAVSVRAEWTWEKIAELPAAPGADPHPGLAGPFAGVHNNVLIIGGGANFPQGLPWDGGEKVYYDDIFVLKKTDTGYVWHDQTFKLPGKLAYGVTISTTNGLVCIGGESRRDGETHYSKKVFTLTWDANNERVLLGKRLMAPGYDRDETLGLPDLPIGTTALSGTLIDPAIYVGGGITPAGYTRDVYELRLNRRVHAKGSLADTSGFNWRKLPAWRGPPRSHCIITHQEDGLFDNLLVLSGRNQDADGTWHLLTDFMVYNRRSRGWLQMGDVRIPGEPTRCIMAGSVLSDASYRVHILGGDDGDLFRKLNQTLPDAIKGAGEDAVLIQSIEEEKRHLLEHHPGFGNELISYNMLTDSWQRTGEFPGPLPVTTTAVAWGKEVILPSGEVRPGVRSPVIWKGRYTE